MSEKITFQELIESIAKETDNSKKFTHDFLKDFVNVIHDGLKSDGKVNIAGLGKFGLRKIDEREGYNPQTGENMTIPAHNKVVFKPYKDLRELVNAPYAHMEARIIGDEKEDTGQKEEKVEKEQDFIPIAPPTNVENQAEEQTETQGNKNKGEPFEEQPAGNTSENFSLDKSPQESKTETDEDEDIVEFRHEQQEEKEAEKELDLAHHERFIDESPLEPNNATTGKVHQDTITMVLRGAFLGGPFQGIPNATYVPKPNIRG
jgi:nucleoid DNA-binding protein